MSAKGGAVSGPATVGALIDGKYRVEKVLGEGDVGVVVAAENVSLGERVALKFLRPELLELAERFTAAAKAASTIECEHAVTVFEVGRTKEEDQRVPYLVMELLAGEDLASARDSLEVADIAELAMQTCEALAAAHAKGIVHRGLDAKHLRIEPRAGARSIKVVGFGLSKAALSGPEEADARDDLRALGAVLREALGGKEPTGLVAIIDKCLAKDPKDRYQNAAELANALIPFAPKRARASASRSMVPSHGAVAVPNGPPPASDKVKTVIATLAVVVGLAGTAYSITNRAHPPEPDKAAVTTSEAASASAPKPAEEAPAKSAEPVQIAPTSSVSAAKAATSAPKPVKPGTAPVFQPGPSRPPPKAGATSTGRGQNEKKPDALDIGY